jgi:hypothetical protein
MLGYLNGIGRARPASRIKSKVTKAKAKAISKVKAQAVKRATPILKKAFAVLPPVMAVKVAQQVIKKNAMKPRAASQLTQQRALKNQLAKTKAKLFVQKNKSMMLDDEDLVETPMEEQNIDDELMDQEVEDEIQQEEEFEEADQDLGIIYETGNLGGRADRKAQRKVKKQAKIEKKQAKTELKKAKATAKVNRSTRERKSAKDMFSDVLDSAKKGVAVYKDFKGGGSSTSEDSENMDPRASRTAQSEEGFFAKNKTMLLIGGGVLAVGAILLLKGKGKNK